jgi:hypothetical protein
MIKEVIMREIGEIGQEESAGHFRVRIQNAYTLVKLLTHDFQGLQKI